MDNNVDFDSDGDCIGDRYEAGDTDWDTAPFDTDGDGHPACEDCDDTVDTTHDGADETCDGVDEDCDGRVDEGLDEYSWYTDEDGDGYGDDDRRDIMCWGDRPDGWIDRGADCDDEDADIHPLATEICDDDIDNYCDEEVDEEAECED